MYRYLGNNFRKIILSKLLRVFLLFIFCITNVVADVIKLDDDKLNGCGAQGSTDIQEVLHSREIDDTRFMEILQNKESLRGMIDEFFVIPNDNDNKRIKHFWQMHGLCIFKLNDVCEVLISKKRNTKANGGNFVIPKVAWNDPYKMEEKEDNIKNKEPQNEFFKKLKMTEKQNKYYASNLFNYSTSIHTERQLNLGALYIIDSNGNVREEDNHTNTDVTNGKLINRALNVYENIEKYNDNGYIINALKRKLQLIQQHDSNTQTISGSMYIYTSANPCQNVSDNGGISCVKYYNELAQLFPNIKFNVYFDADEMQLNKAFFIDNDSSAVALCNFIADNESNIDDLKIEGNCIKIKDNNNNKWMPKVKFKIDKDGIRVWNGINVSKQKIGNINECVIKINSSIARLNIQQKQDLFNSIHNPNNIPNIHYHPI